MPKISKNIKRLRAEHNFTQDALAEKIHVTRQAISNWENDKTKPDIEALESLAQAFGVDIEELIYGEKKEIIISQDKTKEKNRIKIILAIVGTLFVASGLALVFFGFWQEFSTTLQTVFSVIPMLLAQAFAVYTIVKKKNNILWRECSGIIWTIGVVSTIALIDNIYNISWVYTDYLIVDSILMIPIMFIMGSVAPLVFFYYMTIHIATVGSLFNIIVSMILLIMGIVFTSLISRNIEDVRGKLAQWFTMLASIPLIIIYAIAGIDAGLFADALSVIFSILIAYFLCLFIVAPEKSTFSLPHKPIAIVGLCVSMLASSVDGIYDTAKVKYYVLPFVISAVVCILPPVVAGIFKRNTFEDNKTRIITTVLPLAMIAWTYVYAIVEECTVNLALQGSITRDTEDIIRAASFYVGAILTLAFGGMLVYQGVNDLQLFVINVGVITVFVQIMSIYSRIGPMNILVLGILLALFGIGLIVLNWKMLSIRKKSQEQLEGGNENA